MESNPDEKEQVSLNEDDWSLFKGLGLTLKCAGVLVAAITLFRPADWRTFLGLGVCFVLLGFFLSLLDEVFNRPDSLPPIDAPALRARWKAGFVVLMCCWFMLNPLFDIFGGLIDWLHPGKADSSMGLLALKWGAFVILAPLIFSTLWEERRLARLWAFWRRGFIVLFLGGLVLLPALLVMQGSQLIRNSGVVEKGSQEEAVLVLLATGINIVLVPFWILPLSRWISNSPLGNQASWFFERWRSENHVEE